VETIIKLTKENQFEAKVPSGAIVRISGADASGTLPPAFRPMEMLLVGLGACTAVNVISILSKMREPFRDYEIRLKGERAPQPPKVFTNILMEHLIYGSGLSQEKVVRALELAETYCSAFNMLIKATKIERSIRIIENAGEKNLKEEKNGEETQKSDM